MNTPITQPNFEIKKQPSDSITEQLLGSDLAIAEYTSFRDEDDKELRIGLFGEDLVRALEHPLTITVNNQNKVGENVFLPAIVPIAILEWYNTDLIERIYGSMEKVFVYVHPPIEDDDAHNSMVELLWQMVDQGYVIITEKYADDDSSPIAQVVNESKYDDSYSVEAFGGHFNGEHIDSRVDFYVGKVSIKGGDGKVRNAPSLAEVYNELLITDELVRDDANGTDLAMVIEGDEADEIWQVYEKPFVDLGVNDPTLDGFEKETLFEILKDPSIVKVVNRVDNEITTLMIFLQDFDKAPWFNKTKYKKNYSEFYDTDNVLIFPGIVSNIQKRGQHYATDVIDFTCRLLAKRGSDFIITFECTQESTTYIPEIVTGALQSGGHLVVEGLDQPIGALEYYGLSKSL